MDFFELWLQTQPAIITSHFSRIDHPVTKWSGMSPVVRGGQWCNEATEQPLAAWLQYILNRTFRKPYGAKISKQEVQYWISSWKQEQQ